MLTLCGSVALVAPDGRRVPLAAKYLALLAYLALERGTHTRDSLCALLWGDSPDEQAHASLRQALTRLRTAVGDALHVERTTVALADDFVTDVDVFLRDADAGRATALDVDVPRFLDGLGVRDAQRFEEWAERTREALVRRYRARLVDDARSASARHDWQRALALGERWRRLDPLSDDAAHFHVEALYLRGDRDGALATYRDFRALRKRETGHEPGLALRGLATRIESAPDHAKPAPARAVSGRMRPRPSLDGEVVGRATEWGVLEAALAEVSAGHGRVVVIEGEHGVGRTRLVEDFLRLAATRGATVLRGRVHDAGVDVSQRPLFDVVRGALDAPGAAGTDARWLAELAHVVPEVRQHFPSLPNTTRDPADARVLLHEAIAQLLIATAEEAPVVIALDDLHWADADSCNAIQQLVRRLADTPILWCSTFALGDTPRDAASARLLRSLGAMPGARRLRLEPLALDDVWTLIRSLGRVRNPQGGLRFATRVHELTGGNALYVIELLETLFARGWLSVEETTGEWMAAVSSGEALVASEMFPSVREGISERIAALPDEEHAVLLTVAAAGRGCHTSLLSYGHGISRLRAAHLCDALVARRLVVEEADGTYRCTHALIASVVLDSVGPTRRREVHRMIALALTDAAASVRRAVDPGVIARHAELGGEPEMAHRHALLASEACVAQGAWDDAQSWLDLAASCAETAAEREAVDAARASLAARAGWSATAERTPTPRYGTPTIDPGDVDLLAEGAA